MTTGRKLIVTGILATGAVWVVTRAISNWWHWLKSQKLHRRFSYKSPCFVRDNKCRYLQQYWPRVFASLLDWWRRNLLTSLRKVTVSTILYWSMIEGGLAIIAACLPTLHHLVRKVSLSSIFSSLRSALSFGSVHTQGQQHQQQEPPQEQWSQGYPPLSKESYIHIHAGSSTSSTSHAVREKNKTYFVAGSVERFSEPQRYGIQVTRQFSQDASMVWISPCPVELTNEEKFFFFRTFFQQRTELSFHYFNDGRKCTKRYITENGTVARSSLNKLVSLPPCVAGPVPLTVVPLLQKPCACVWNGIPHLQGEMLWYDSETFFHN